MELVAFVGKDMENWGQISALINREKWDKIILVKNNEANGFPKENCEVVNVKSGMPITELRNDIANKLRSSIKGNFEVAVSLASGNGKEHMALISALLNLPVGVRLVAFTKEGVQFIS